MIATPHITAGTGDFAPTVLMPGDPLRSRFIAQNFLTAPRLVNDVRGVQGYTGTFDGVPVSVMASGMGMPSMAIYAEELFTRFGVENIIRTGSAGALSEKLCLRDVVLADAAVTDSNIVEFFGRKPLTDIPASDALLSAAKRAAEPAESRVTVGRLYSSDVFYSGRAHGEMWRDRGALAVEMEAAALYAVALKCGKRALAVCTVSDDALTGEGLSAREREQSFSAMIGLALRTAVSLDGARH